MDATPIMMQSKQAAEKFLILSASVWEGLTRILLTLFIFHK
jgi:hypothetical protein